MTDITTTENKLGTFLTAHHFVLYGLLILAMLMGVYLFESKRADVASNAAIVAREQLTVEKDHSAQIIQLYANQQIQLDKQNAIVLSTMAQLQAQTKTIIVHDKALPAPDLGHRIETLTGFKQGTIQLDASQDLIVPLPLAVDITVRLDQGVADAETVVSQRTLLGNQVITIANQGNIIAEDKVVLAATIKADAKELTACKTSARKGKLKWFGIGVIVGFVGRELIKP